MFGFFCRMDMARKKPVLKSGEAILTNDQVIEMVKSGLKPEAITGQIRNSKNSFDFSTPEFIKLVKAGVPESVIAAMRDATGARSAPVPPSGGAWPSRPKGSMLKLTDGEKVRLILMDDLSSATANTGIASTSQSPKISRLGMSPSLPRARLPMLL